MEPAASYIDRDRGHLKADGTPKIRFMTKSAALVAVVTLQAKKGCCFREYRCQCGGWHVAHDKPAILRETA